LHPDHQIAFYAFDLLHVDGQDLTVEPLFKRIARLRRVVEASGLLLSRELPGTAAEVVEAVQEAGLEGVVAKRRTSLYKPGKRNGDWIKLKIEHEQEFVIGGYRPGRDGMEALLVGCHERQALRFAGIVRTGLVKRLRLQIGAQLRAIHSAACPFGDLPGTGSSHPSGLTTEDIAEIQWVEPRLVAQIRFAEWTADQRLRHPRFIGLRSDKPARSVQRES